MEQQEHPAVRNDALRLTLSRQEADYIDEQLMAARQSLKVLAIVAGTGGFLLVIVWLLAGSETYFGLTFDDPDLRSSLRIAGYLVGAGTGIVTFVAILKIPFAWLNLAKYKSYRTEHDRFLDKYNRRHQDDSPRP